MVSDRVRALKQRLDQLVGDPGDDEEEDEPSPEEMAVFEEAIRHFRDHGPELLDTATEHLWAYYRDVAAEFTPAQRQDYGIPEIDESADIWDHVDITRPPGFALGGHPLEPGISYISFEGEVSWEPEHGLQLVFDHGRRVCKVGPYDGHNTNGHAYNDPTLIDVVFV